MSINPASYIQQNKDRFLEELFALLRIPSIGVDPTYKEATHQAARFIEQQLQDAGLDHVEVMETPGFPFVYGEKMIDPSLPTILVYGHYDVQPPDPIEKWESAPFEPTLREGNIYARGASDDKGQLHAQIKAFEVMAKTHTLPCNVKFFIEGEEEIASPSMQPFLKELAHQKKLAADVILISDTYISRMDQPTIISKLRGAMIFELHVTGPKRDLHSGAYGGAVKNPIHALTALLAALHDENHQITIPGFYDQVENLSAQERAQIADPSFNEESYKKELGVKALAGEKGYTTTERLGIRPTLEVNGIWGGTIGVKKTVIPSQAHAILSMRVVPHQEPDTIAQQFEKHIQHLAQTLPALQGTTVTLEYFLGKRAVNISTQSKATKALQKAYEKGWGGQPPRLVCEGASIPLITDFQEYLKSDVALLGMGLPDDKIHAPNEKLGVKNYFKGIDTIIAFYHAFAEEK